MFDGNIGQRVAAVASHDLILDIPETRPGGDHLDANDLALFANVPAADPLTRMFLPNLGQTFLPIHGMTARLG